MRIAFYAPLKAPDHPVPSGDRAMARLLVAALRGGGHEIEIVSTLRSFVGEPDAARQAEVERSAHTEAASIAARWQHDHSWPDLWFTYHTHYKAPDLLGPGLARAFGIPYATAEASHAAKRRHGPWATWHSVNEAAIRAGAIHFCFTDVDRRGVEPLLGPAARFLALPPFIDARGLAKPARPAPSGGPIELIAVAMMRPGAKTRSYAFLARALARLPARLAWRLTVIGDGPARGNLSGILAQLQPGRVSWRGELGPTEIAAALRAADVFVWPGYDEAYGISYLEAGACGLPVVAMRSGGTTSVVVDGMTGILTDEGDLEAYAGAMATLIEDADLRRRLGEAAHTLVSTERTLARASKILSDGLASVMQEQSLGREPG